VAAIREQNSLSRPQKLKRSPAPLFRATSHKIHRELYEGYAWFTTDFRTVAEKLKSGDRMVVFPSGSFPPALPIAGA
jgi:hypothetical protein